MKQPTLPTNAHEFIAFMQRIWERDDEILYQAFHHAIATARKCGAVRTGGTIVGGTRFHVYRFPDDNEYVIRICYDGAGVEAGRHRRKGTKL